MGFKKLASETSLTYCDRSPWLYLNQASLWMPTDKNWVYGSGTCHGLRCQTHVKASSAALAV